MEKRFVIDEIIDEIDETDFDKFPFYFSCVLDPTVGYNGAAISAVPPHIEGRVLTIYCVPWGMEETLLVKIDMEAEKIISTNTVVGAKGLAGGTIS